MAQREFLVRLISLNKLISKLKISEIVNIYNQIPHNEMLNALSKAHIAVIPFHDHPMFQNCDSCQVI